MPSVADDLSLSPQAKTVLHHLRRHDHITPMKALVVYGISRLADCIYKIKKVGYTVNMKIMRDDEGHRYARYSLAEAQ